MSDIVRGLIHGLVSSEGYLRPPDHEPQDFGYEKEMIEYVNAISSDQR